jgi:signal transduction histidine kinase
MMSNQFLYGFEWGSFRLWSVVLAALSCYALGFLAYVKNKNASLNRAFALFVFALGSWNIMDFSFLIHRLSLVVLILRASYFFAVLVVPAFYYLCQELSDRRFDSPRGRKILWGSTILLLSIVPSPWLISGVRTDPYVVESPGPLFPLFGVYLLGWTILSFTYVLRGFLSSSGVKRNQLRYALLSFFFLYLAAAAYIANTVFPQIPPSYYVPEVLSNIILAYAVVRYRLMDINLAFRYGTVYSLLALAIGVPIAALGVWWTGSWKSGLIGFLAPLAGYLVAERLMPALTQIIDYLPLFRGRYENFRDVKRHEALVRQALSLAEWRDNLSAAVKTVLKADHVQVLPMAQCGSMEPEFLSALNSHNVLMNDFLSDLIPAPHLPAVRQKMASLGANLCARLSDRTGELSALLCVGPKGDDSIWNDLDLTALWTLARVGEETLRDLQQRETLVKKERLAAIGEMASVVSHELKTPLAVIQNSTSFLTNRLTSEQDEKVRKHLGIIEAQTQSLGSVVTGILDYARSRELKLEPGQINDLVQEVVGCLSIPKGVEVSTNYSPEIPELNYDREEMKQVVRNVVTNALQAMPQGGKLKVETRKTETGGAEIRVTDTGGGISEKDLPRIFEPFYTTKGDGTGLGLAVVKKVMDRHHGEVQIRSAFGVGTSVVLRIPGV